MASCEAAKGKTSCGALLNPAQPAGTVGSLCWSSANTPRHAKPEGSIKAH